MLKQLSIMFFLFTALVLCCGPFQNPVSAEYPCGTQGLVCGGGMCCWRGDQCGAEGTSCPAGYCCFIGDESNSAMAAKAKLYPQVSRTEAGKR